MTETLAPKALSAAVNQTSPAQLTLHQLAEGINNHLQAMTDGARNIVMRAFEVGALLRQAKANFEHGDFGDWLDKNCQLSVRTAQRYMALAADRKTIEEKLKLKNATVADISLRQAERLISDRSNNPGKDKKRPTGEASDDTTRDDPLNAISKHEDPLLQALKDLKKSDLQKARSAASKIVQRFKDAELIEATA